MCQAGGPVLVSHSVEVLPGRLFCAALSGRPQDTARSHYFSDLSDLADQGLGRNVPPNLADIIEYCRLLSAKLANPQLAGKRLVHCCAEDASSWAAAALLICAYQVIVRGESAQSAFEAFQDAPSHMLTFPGVGGGPGCCGKTPALSVPDCLRALERAVECGWLDWQLFDVVAYRFYLRPGQGNVAWIVPQKLLAFSEPEGDAEGKECAAASVDRTQTFLEAGVGLTVALSRKHYDTRHVLDQGIEHVGLYVPTGRPLSRRAISKFLHLVEAEPAGVALQCKTDEGCSSALAALFLMKHHFFSSKAAAAWLRLCRPACLVHGQNEDLLAELQNDMFKSGFDLRCQEVAVRLSVQRCAEELAAAGADRSACTLSEACGAKGRHGDSRRGRPEEDDSETTASQVTEEEELVGRRRSSYSSSSSA